MRRVELDTELCFEPSYFLGLDERLEVIEHAQVTLKRGFCKNELACFRFDVVLSNEVPRLVRGASQRQWREESWNLSELEEELKEQDTPAVIVSSIPNERLIGPVWLSRQLDETDPFTSCEDLTRVLGGLANGVEPEALYRLGERLSYDVQLRRSGERPDLLDALFVRRDESSSRPCVVPQFEALHGHTPDAEPVTTPLLKQLCQSVGPELGELCRRRLPEYMVPSRIALVAHLPVNLNGKLDESRLPMLAGSRLLSDQPYVEPAGPIERVVAEVWQEILAIDRVGAHDDFLGLGGHSLLAMEAVARLEAVFQTRIPLASFFGTSPSVRGVAKVIAENEREPGEAQRIAEIWQQIQAMTEAEVEAQLHGPQEHSIS